MAKPKKLTLAQRIARDPALKAKYLANPGLRSKLPDSMLTPAQRAQRQTNAFNNAPITEGSSITNKQLGVEANNAVLTQYGGERQALTADQQRAQSLGRDTADWYAAYRAELAQHAANTQAIGAAAVAQDAQVAQGVRGLDQQQTSDQLAAMQKDAAIRGATVDPSLAQTASNASQVRQQMLAGYGSAQAATGAARSQYADTLAHVVAPTQELQARAQAANRVNAVGDQLKNLSQREGAAKANYVAGRVADEAKTVLSKQALGLDVQKAQQGAAVDAANIDIKRGIDPVTHKKIVKPLSPTAEKTKADLAFFKQHGYYPPTGPPKPAKPGSTAATDRKVAANTKIRTAITTAKADAAYLKTQEVPVRGPDGKPEVDKDDKPTGRTRSLTGAEIRAGLRKKYKDADVANAAMDLLPPSLGGLGHISPENQRRLEARGIGVPKAWLPKTARKTGTIGSLGPALSSGSKVTSKPPVPLP
jgi:hypothetical protein